MTFNPLLRADLLSLVRYHNFNNGIRKIDDPKKINPVTFLEDYSSGNTAQYDADLVDACNWRLSIQEDHPRKASPINKLNTLRSNFGYGAQVMAFKARRLMQTSSTTLQGSFGILREIHGKQIALDLVKRNKLILTAKPETMEEAHLNLKNIHDVSKAKEIGIKNPRVYTSANVKSSHDALVLIHDVSKAKEIGIQNPVVYTSTNVKSSHDALVLIHGDSKAKEIGIQNPQVYTSTIIGLIHLALSAKYSENEAKNIGVKCPSVYYLKSSQVQHQVTMLA